MAVSQNGYIANDITLTQSWKIPGTTRAVRLRKGAPGNLLVLFAAWFDKNVEDIEAGQLDDWGYAERPIRGSTTTLSNHASGTAVDLNSTKHPLGKRGTFTPAQAARIRAELLRYGGCIRWGGDYAGRPDEMHFEIVRDVAACNKILSALTNVKPTPEELDMDESRLREIIREELHTQDVNLWVALTGTGKKLVIDKLKTVQAQLDEIKAKLP
jgi:hypothetical protein